MAPNFRPKELLYVPNLIGYVRLALVAYAIPEHIAPVASVAVLCFSFLLDLFDGPIARWLDQCSVLGTVLDIVCDNTGRTVMWMKAAAVRPDFTSIAFAVVALEWLTLCATQTQAYLEGNRALRLPSFDTIGASGSCGRRGWWSEPELQTRTQETLEEVGRGTPVADTAVLSSQL
eukprot:158827-Rhodomonas_salina.7